MHSYGPRALQLQNRYSAVFPETNSIHQNAWPMRRRIFVYVFILLLAVALSGSAPGQIVAASGTLSFSPTSTSFGSVAVGSSKTISVTVKNTGTSSVSISSQSVHAPLIFSVSGVTIPYTISAGGSIVLSIRFAPTSAGVFSGYVVYTSNATNSSVQYSFSGTGTSGLGIVATTPSSVGFGTVATGTTNSQTVQIKNTGGSSLTISGATVSGIGFKMSGLSIPLTLAASQTANFTVAFAPTVSGSVTGSVTLNSNASNPTFTLPLSGTGGTATRTISLSTSSLNFGNETVGGTSTLGVAVKNTGNSSLTVSQITVSGTGFGVNSGVSGTTIAAGQTAELGVVFAPKTTGSVTGKVTITSNATNSPNSITTAGTGVSNTSHSVALSWAASTSSGVVGYYVYRSTTSGGSFSRLTSSVLTVLKYTDGSVSAGETYYYVVTAVSSSGTESAYSGQVTAIVP
jgi:hypothetical protein